MRTPNSLANTGNNGSQIRNALELAKAASASKIMTGMVDVEELGSGCDVMKRSFLKRIASHLRTEWARLSTYFNENTRSRFAAKRSLS